MRTQVEFRSDNFPPYEDEENELHQGLWGKRLAEYIQEKLPNHGLKVSGIGPEDWGWMVEIENDGFPLWIGCGHQDGDSDEFLCFIEPSKPFVRKGFKKVSTIEAVSRVSEALNTILASTPDIRDIHWASE
jgi:hypothetical protein